MRAHAATAERAGGGGRARGGIGSPEQPCAAQRPGGEVGRSSPMSSPLLDIHHEEVEPGVVVITLAGKLMLGREGEQVEDLVPELLAGGHRTIIFDIAGLTRVDSTGIGRFISSYNKIEQAGGRMAITAASPHL